MEPIKHWLMQKSSTGAIVLLSVALGASLAGRWDHPTAVTAADHVVVQAHQHVVASATRLTVRLQDGHTYPAHLVGADGHSDLAVIRFNPGHALGDRYVARMGDSDRVRVGQWAIAIGSPLGYDTTLTTGVISAKGRELHQVSGQKDYSGLIQTDA